MAKTKKPDSATEAKEQVDSDSSHCSSPQEFAPDEDRYLKTMVPHESVEVATKEMESFFNAINELRVKHKVSDVIFCAHVRWREDDETRCVPMTMTFGNQATMEALAAIAYGEERKKREANIARLLG